MPYIYETTSIIMNKTEKNYEVRINNYHGTDYNVSHVTKLQQGTRKGCKKW